MFVVAASLSSDDTNTRHKDAWALTLFRIIDWAWQYRSDAAILIVKFKKTPARSPRWRAGGFDRNEVPLAATMECTTISKEVSATQ